MLENGCCKVILQRPRQPQQTLANSTPSAQAYAIIHEMSTNFVDNGGYTFTGWMTNKTIARFERDGDVVFLAILPVNGAA